jgi:4-phosphopantoate--beta-alanine ligase
MGKRVITVDLNPLSRTAGKASLTIVDNLVRCMPLLVEEVERLQREAGGGERTGVDFDNGRNLRESLSFIRERLDKLTREQENSLESENG